MSDKHAKNELREPHCPECGYTKQDALIHWDHCLCKGAIPGYDAIAESGERKGL